MVRTPLRSPVDSRFPPMLNLITVVRTSTPPARTPQDMGSSKEAMAQASNTVRKDHKNQTDNLKARAEQEGISKKNLSIRLGSHTIIDKRKELDAPRTQSDRNTTLQYTRVGVMIPQEEKLKPTMITQLTPEYPVWVNCCNNTRRAFKSDAHDVFSISSCSSVLLMRCSALGLSG